ncbi:MAG: hypothetical protein HGA44_04230 [Cellulomonadaceae bacterium]|nr:hypothetical protein [Cellulomonadaceae bacterium]
MSTADLEAAEVVRSEASDALLRATSLLTGLRERLAQRLAVAGGADAATLAADLDAAASSVTAAVAAGRQVATQAQALETFDLESADLERELAEVSAMLAGDDARLTALRTAIASIEAEVSGARAGAASVQARVAALDQRIAQTVAWSEALRSLEDALVQLDARNDELSRALAEHGFTDAAAVHAAWLEPASVATLDAEVSAYEASLAGVRAGLGAPEVVALAELPLDAVADVDGALAAHAAAADVARSAAERAATLTDRAASTAAALTEVERAVTEAAEAHLRAGPVTRMANLAAASGGDNTEHLTLATYVLGRRFDDVVAAANSRLVSLSDGRYELTASTEREDVRSRRRGLAMKVVDHVTETARDPRTLSGGETFYVSLCLALGLADVVTAEAGGIDLGTLFVDEGFGSLDAETLDNVLAALGRLRDGGRVVGVVSHVDALKSSIAERIEVRRRPDGASTLTVRA